MTKRAMLVAAGAIAVALNGASPATAQVYPSRLVTIIVPFSAGGTTDIIARILAEHMSRTLAQQFIVENVVGAGGTTRSTRALPASPHGHPLQFGHIGTPPPPSPPLPLPPPHP